MEALRQKALSALSGGERQKIYLAMVLTQDTPVILMDEPTTYLDINHQFELLRLVRELADSGTGRTGEDCAVRHARSRAGAGGL